ncbi:MAG: hypothetical protein MRY83_00040, partial [Flavobacteriales bacterium]|nr:hypothetical protein [Flavobacteriales bacterium]
MNHRISFILLLLILGVNYVMAQKGDARLANELLSRGEFEAALEEFLLLIEDKPDKLDYHYNAGVCYLNSNFNKTKSIEHLEKVVKSESNFDNNAHYLLGRAYLFNYDFDKAINMFKIYTKNGGGTAANSAELTKQIEYCYNAKELIKFPLNLKFENLGNNVNSKYSDYYPFIPTDESYIVYNSKREVEDEDGNSFEQSDVYMTKVKDGKFQKSEIIEGKINTEYGSEEVVGLSSNGDIMLLYFKNDISDGDLYITHRVDSGFEKPVRLDDFINSKKHQEIAASITKTGDVIYFASDRPGGFGGTDIYVCRKLPIGGWGPAQNLGPFINTEFDEDFPNISADGKTLYFSSKGHTSMGGYDIFEANWDHRVRKFTNIRNIGYPLNTTYDDMNFRMSETGRYGYIASIKEEGKGDYDIYRVTFNEIETRYTVIKGEIRYEDGSLAKDIEEIFMDITD